jgi:hypothetical protein
MNKPPITHLVIDTSSTNEDYNGDCDYCLVPMTAEYILYLLAYMDEVRRMHRTDDAVYSLECWDGSFSYFQFNDKLEELRDVDGNIAIDVPRAHSADGRPAVQGRRLPAGGVSDCPDH